ncbi:MAG: AMP-binding protein [Alphaproteobacteria bacterium]|nr:AMP-binding protein [Alphaproteobacteria bacterium]
MNIARLLWRAARVCGHRPALALGERTVASYGEFAAAAAALAGGLAGMGARPGDRVAIVMKNGPDYMRALYACWHGGLVAVPVNAKLHAREIAYILDHAGVRAALATPDLAETTAAAARAVPHHPAVIVTGDTHWRRLAAHDPLDPVERADDDVAWLFYTSGTTGRPKGAMLTHRNLFAMTQGYLSDVDAVPDEATILHAAPMSHGSGLYNFMFVLRGALQAVPESGGFQPDEMFRLFRRHKQVALFAAPTMVRRLVDHAAATGADPAGLRTIVYGGGPMYVADCKAALAALGNRLVQIYGQGESPMTITVLTRAVHADTAHPRYEQRLASVGVAQSGIAIKIADARDHRVPQGEIGEVLVRGDAVMKGYWNDAAATARALKDGWLHTGDLGSLDEDGFLTLKDRSKDMIISGGSNIYPREIEEVLLTHAEVAEAAVVGRPHPEWGEEVMAFVVRRPGGKVGENELDALCLAHIARFKRPKVWRFVDALPKNNYGKVLKTELRKLAAEPRDG